MIAAVPVPLFHPSNLLDWPRAWASLNVGIDIVACAFPVYVKVARSALPLDPKMASAEQMPLES